MESANLLDTSLFCCCRCKGLFSVQDDKLKHQINCMGNPQETNCAYFACERKIFLQLFQPEDFLLDGCDQPFLFSKDDSFINHFVKIRVPDIFDPSIFLKSTTQPIQEDTDDANFLLESNINTLEEETEKSNGNSFLESNKQVGPIDQEHIQSIINKNIEYLKNDDISSLGTEPSKNASPFHHSQSLPRLLSPIDKHLHLFGDGTKSRLHSPFERSSSFLQDGQIGYSSGNFMYSSNPSIPFSCGLSTDLFSSIPPTPDENQQGFPTNIEEIPTLKYLDLAKKDPFFGQNPGLAQINTKDPFLINATLKTTERTSFGLQKSQITRSCEDLQSSPMLPVQEGNYFNFPSTLDEPTQLDYLDLATLDFLTNPNLISYGTGVFKEKSYDRDDGTYSEGTLTDQEQSSARSETAVRLSTVPVSDNGDIDSVSAFSKVKKKKLRLKKSKSDIGKRHENATSGNRSFFAGFPVITDDLQQSVINCSDNLISIHPKGSRSLVDAGDFRICRKRKLDTPKEKNAEAKLMKMNRKSSESRRISKSDRVFNVREKLTHLTEKQKDSMKAVIGQSGCIFVKKKRSLSCDEPVVFVNDSQVFGDIDMFSGGSKFEERPNKFQPVISNSKALFDKQCKTGKLTSVLQFKCLECDFRCRSVVELKNHRVVHTKPKKLELSAIEIQQPDMLPTDTFSKNQNCSEMLQEGIKCSVVEVKDTQGDTNGDSVLLQTNDLLTTVPATESTENVLIVSVSAPNSSGKSQSVFDKGVVICDATKEFVARQPKAVSLLPKKITDIAANLSDSTFKDAYCEPYGSDLNTVESLSAELSNETAMAVQAIEDINNECEDSPNETRVSFLQDTCLINEMAETGNIVKEMGSDGVPKQEMQGIDYKLEVHVENTAGTSDMNCNDKINVDYEFTAVPLKSYNTNVISVDIDQSSVETLRQDFTSKTETGNEVTVQVTGQYGSELSLMEQDLPLFEECETAECLDGKTGGTEQQTQTDQIESDCKVDLNDSVKLKNEYLNTGKGRTDTTMIKENVLVQKGSGGKKTSETKVINEIVDFDKTQTDVFIKEETDRVQESAAKSIQRLDENILHSISNEVSFQFEKDEKVSTAVIEHAYSETINFHETDAKLAVTGNSQINENVSEKQDLKDDNYWTFVESICSDNITEPSDGQKYATSVENEKISTFDQMENTSDARAIDTDQDLVFAVDNEIVKTSLPTDKIHTDFDVTEQTSLYQEHLLDISDQGTENKPVLDQYFCGTEILMPNVQFNHKVPSSDSKNTENDHVTLTVTESVEEQNVSVCSNNFLTDTEKPVSGCPDDMECAETPTVPDIEHVPISETVGLAAIDITDVIEQSKSISGFVPVSESDALSSKGPMASNKFTKIQNVTKNESLPAFKTESFCIMGTPSIAEKTEKCAGVYRDADLVSSNDNCTDKDIHNIISRSKIQNFTAERTGCIDFNEMQTAVDVIATGPTRVAGSINSSKPETLGAPEACAAKMQSLLGGNIVHIASVSGQHVNTIGNPVKLCATENTDQASVKDLSCQQSEVCSLDGSEDKISSTDGSDDTPDTNSVRTEHFEGQADTDSVRTEHLSDYFLNKDIFGAGTKTQTKASDGAFHCDVKGCQFKTLYKSNVSTHYQQVHLNLKRFICDQCTYATPNLSCLKHHLQLTHYKEKRFKCPECNYLSLFHSDIVKHVRHTHMKQKQFACNQCEYRTGHSHSLKLHIMAHNGIRPYKCNTCDYRANSSNRVIRHIGLCHKNEVGVACEKQDLTFEIDAKQFQCEEVTAYQDIRVIELSAEEANAIMKEKTLKKETEKQKKDIEQKAKAEKKVKKVKKTASKHLNKISKNINDKDSQEVKVIKLTPEAAKALMEAKSEKRIKNCEETVKYTKVLPKPKSLLSNDTKVAKFKEETSGCIREINEKNIGKVDPSLKIELKSNESLQPRIIKMEISSGTKRA